MDQGDRPSALIDRSQLNSLIRPEIREEMAKIIVTSGAASAVTQAPPSVSVLATPSQTGLPAHFSTILPALVELKGQIIQELERTASRLLALNPSRREALACHLDRLAGGTTAGNAELRRWVEGPRTSSQNVALQAYFEEIAVIVLGQSVLLKSWADRGLHAWNPEDLGRLNHTMSVALRRQPNWHLTRQNIYSWYNPATEIQQEIWARLSAFPIEQVADDSPYFLTSLVEALRQTRPISSQPEGYDSRFFQALWDHSALFNSALL